MSFGSDDVRNLELALVAGFTAITTMVTAYGKYSQRKRDTKKEEFDRAVAAEVQKVKITLEDSTTKSTEAICAVKDELEITHGQVNKVHTIVNSEKTAGMEELRTSRLLTLTAFKALLATNPDSKNLQEAVAAAQALYDKIDKETINKIATDALLKAE